MYMKKIFTFRQKRQIKHFSTFLTLNQQKSIKQLRQDLFADTKFTIDQYDNKSCLYNKCTKFFL